MLNNHKNAHPFSIFGKKVIIILEKGVHLQHMCNNIELYSVYAQLIEQHKKKIWAVCWRYCHGDRERCRDLMQDVALVLWTRIDRLRDDATPQQIQRWVVLNARSVARNLMRKPEINTTEITFAMADYLAEDDSKSQLSETLQEILSWLNTDDRRFVNDYLQGYTYKELAVKYNINPDSANKRMHLIIQKLRKIKDKIYQ